jgi:hypothetical protein
MQVRDHVRLAGKSASVNETWRSADLVTGRKWNGSERRERRLSPQTIIDLILGHDTDDYTALYVSPLISIIFLKTLRKHTMRTISTSLFAYSHHDPCNFVSTDTYRS